MNSANIIIGQKRFLNKYKDKNPGPGEYEIPSLITKAEWYIIVNSFLFQLEVFFVIEAINIVVKKIFHLAL